jgi:hypothetical protein
MSSAFAFDVAAWDVASRMTLSDPLDAQSERFPEINVRGACNRQ